MNRQKPPFTLSSLVSAIEPRLLAAIAARHIAGYVGERHPDPREDSITTATPVQVFSIEMDGRQTPLDLRLDIRNHSPTGPNWGYAGSGPAQLALAILAHYTGSPAFACRYYQQFKLEVLSRVASSRLDITAAQLNAYIAPKLPEFLNESLASLFDEDGTISQWALITNAGGSDAFQFELSAGGQLYLVNTSDTDPTPGRTLISDLPTFYVESIFPAKP